MSEKSFTISTKYILDRAARREIQIETVCPGRIAKLTLGDHIEYVYNQFVSATSAVALKICDEKGAAKSFLSLAGISVSKGKEFSLKQPFNEVRDEIKEFNFPLVLKPTNSTHGNLVVTDIKSAEELEDYWDKIKESKFSSVLIEEFFVGTEYRVFATKEKTVAVTNRVAANVTGDGTSMISQLIEVKNTDERRGEDDTYSEKPLVKIKIDDASTQFIENQNLTFNSVPGAGERIFIRGTSNLSTGGDSVDFTDKVHPSVREICVKVINAIPGLSYGGIDFMSKDITKEQQPGDYIIIEINSSPGLFMHHYPFEGEERDAAGAVIDILFPETKN